MTVPRWSAKEQDALVVYVGFDPDGVGMRAPTNWLSLSDGGRPAPGLAPANPLCN